MHLIEIFHIEGQDTVTLSSSCSSCSSGCAPVENSINKTILEFEKKYSADASISRFILTEDNKDALAQRLQEVYQNSDEGLIITASNVKYILSKLSPIIAFDGKLVANNYVPDADELKFSLDHGIGIDSSLCQ